MMNRLFAITLILIFVSASTLPTVAHAQRNAQVNSVTAGPGKRLSTIIFSGVAGAILGLSTLSFYGRPQEKLDHIAIGAAIGIIGGAMYTTFKAATEPKDFYNLRQDGPRPELWNVADSRIPSETLVPSAQFVFEF